MEALVRWKCGEEPNFLTILGRLVPNAIVLSGLRDQAFNAPSIVKPLFGILAVAADISEMFSQVNIRQEEHHAQRFLWRSHPGQPVKYCEMTSMVFGAISSLCFAENVKNQNALDFQEQYPDACRKIQLHIYVDSSQRAFAAVGYLRIEHAEGVDVAFVRGKTHCARLELCAAVLGARKSNAIQQCLSGSIAAVTFWSDS